MPPRSNYVGGNTRTASLIEREVSGHLSPSACHPFRELTSRAFATLACHFKGILTKVAEVNQQMHSVTSRAHGIWTQTLQPCMIMHAYCIECNFKTDAASNHVSHGNFKPRGVFKPPSHGDKHWARFAADRCPKMSQASITLLNSSLHQSVWHLGVSRQILAEKCPFISFRTFICLWLPMVGWCCTVTCASARVTMHLGTVLACITYFLHLKGHRCLASLVSANAMQAIIGFNSCCHRYHRISVFCCRVTRCIAIPKEFDTVFHRLFHRLFHWFQFQARPRLTLILSCLSNPYAANSLPLHACFSNPKWTNLRRSGFPQVVFPSLCLMYSIKRQIHSNVCALWVCDPFLVSLKHQTKWLNRKTITLTQLRKRSMFHIKQDNFGEWRRSRI